MKRSPGWILFDRILLCGVVVLWGRTIADGATNTWDGGGTDNNWSTAANWNPDGTTPVGASNTTVRLDGDTRTSPVQDIADPFVLNRLDILNCAYAGTKPAIYLSGNQLQFAADGTSQPQIYAPREIISIISNNIYIPNGTSLEIQLPTWGIEIRGVISGEGSIDKLQNAGGLSLNNSSNSFSGGLTIRGANSDWCKVNINASNAMGAGPVNLYGGTLITNAANPGGLDFFNTTSHTNPIYLFQDSPIFAGMPSGTAFVTLNGNIDLNDFTLHLRGGGTGTIYGVISEGATNAVTKVDSGTWILSGANTFTGSVNVSNGTLTVNGSINANIAIQEGTTLNGNGTLNWHVGEKVTVAGALDISQLKLNVQVPETSEGEDFIIVDYSPGSLVGSEFVSVSGKPKHCRVLYDTTNSLIILRSFEKGTVVMIQ